MTLARFPVGVGALAVSLTLCAAAPRARAQTNKDAAAATELFDKGRQAMKQLDYATACAAFADSQRFDAKVGTLLNLADCEEHISRLVSARAHWQQAADLAHALGDPRETVARQRFTALDPRVAKLGVRLSPQAPPGSVVRRDDVELGAGSLGVLLPADPGVHLVAVSAKGYADASTQVTLGEGDVQEVVVAPGAKLAPVPVAAPAVAPEAPSTWTGRKTLGVAMLGVGVVGGAVVGTLFGISAKSANDRSKTNDDCSPANLCNMTGLDARNQAVLDGNVSTVAFAAGGAIAIAGLIVWLTSPSPKESATFAMEMGPGGAIVRGVF